MGLNSTQRWALICVIPILIGTIPVVLVGNNQELAPPRVAVGVEGVVVAGDSKTIRIRPEELEAVDLAAQLPQLQPVFGWRSRAALRGSFSADGHAGYIDVSRRHPPYVVIRSSNQIVIVNYSDESRTRELYDLISRVRQGIR